MGFPGPNVNKQPNAETYTDTVLQAQSHMPRINDMVNATKTNI